MGDPLNQRAHKNFVGRENVRFTSGIGHKPEWSFTVSFGQKETLDLFRGAHFAHSWAMLRRLDTPGDQGEVNGGVAIMTPPNSAKYFQPAWVSRPLNKASAPPIAASQLVALRSPAVCSDMLNRLRICAAASLPLLFASCMTATEKDLPALDASRTVAAKALIIETDFAQTSYSPGDVVRGSGDGAMRGMGRYLKGAASHEGALFFGLLFAPIGLPVSAATGASMAHTKEEVDAAVATFERISRDKKRLALVAERLRAALNSDGTRRWACIAAITTPTNSPCAGHSPAARIYLRPAFVLRAKGEFDPDIDFSGSVVAIAKVAPTPSSDKADTIMEVKWEYSEDLGKFFVLGKDDGALLLRKLETVLDRFAEKIARDLYLAPRKEKIVHKEDLLGLSFIEIPKGVVVRVEQGNDIYSRFTHGTVAPRYGFFERNCWIAAVDGRATGHHHDTWAVRRTVAVRNGLAKIEMRCASHSADTDAGSEKLHIDIPVEAGQRYWTDGRSFERIKQ